MRTSSTSSVHASGTCNPGSLEHRPEISCGLAAPPGS